MAGSNRMRLIYSSLSINEKRLMWYAFFMACPFLIIVFNISFFIFPLLFFGYIRGIGLGSFLSKPIQFYAIAFGIGAIISIANIPEDPFGLALERGLAVLPNYIYWSILVTFLIAVRARLNYFIIYRAIFLGLSFSILYYYFLQHIGLLQIPIFKMFTQNGFSFLLVCFTPVSVYFFKQYYGRRKAIILAILYVLAAFLSDSRAGAVLVTFGGFSVLFIDKLKIGRAIVLLLAMLIFGPYFLQIEMVGDLIRNLNEGTYNLIYHSDLVFMEDRSYLIRQAMVEKGLILFQENMYTGIGLNNFVVSEVDFIGDFEGAKYVVTKDDINSISSHNSYINIIAEGGLFLAVPFVLIMGSIVLFFLLYFDRISSFFKPVFIGIICMSIHFYFVTAVVNVFAWFLIGVASAIIYLPKNDIRRYNLHL